MSAAEGMGGDQGCTFLSGLLESLLDPVIDPDERAAADRHGLSSGEGIRGVIGQLEAGEEQQVVLAQRPFRLSLDLGEIGSERVLPQLAWGVARPPRIV